MSELCKNCQYEIALNFCSNCGQKKSKRIDAKYLKDELQYTLVHTNKGFFYSIKKIVQKPGTTARLFLEGDRVNHYKPIALVFILSGICAFLSSNLFHSDEIISDYYTRKGINMPYDMKAFTHNVMKYYSIMMLLSVPFMAVFSWISFKKWGYNYYENVIINAYFLSLFLVFNIAIMIPFQYVLQGFPELFMTLPSVLSMLALLGMAFWFFIGLYPGKSPGNVILRVLLTFALQFGTLVLLTIIGTIAAIIYFKANNLHPQDILPQVPAAKALFQGIQMYGFR